VSGLLNLADRKAKVTVDRFSIVEAIPDSWSSEVSAR
jgi:hypothetical protein